MDDIDDALFRELVEEESTKPVDVVVWEVLWYRCADADGGLKEVREVLIADRARGRGTRFVLNNERAALRQFLEMEHEPDRLMRMVAYDANWVLEELTDAAAHAWMKQLLAVYDEVLG